MRSSVRGRNADMSYLALFFPTPESRQVGFPIPQVVNLHEVHDRHPHKPHRFLHLKNDVLSPIGPDFGCGKKGGATGRIVKTVAYDLGLLKV